MFLLWVLISDKEVVQEQFKLEPPSGVLSEDSLRAVCNIRLPDENWEPQTIARVSTNIG